MRGHLSSACRSLLMCLLVLLKGEFLCLFLVLVLRRVLVLWPGTFAEGGILEGYFDQQAPTLPSNGLLMRNERTGAEWRVPSDDTAKLRSPAALPKPEEHHGRCHREALRCRQGGGWEGGA